MVFNFEVEGREGIITTVRRKGLSRRQEGILSRGFDSGRKWPLNLTKRGLGISKKLKGALSMEICGKAPMMNEEATNVVYLSSLLNKQEDVIAHKCDRRCDIEHVWANIYRCKLAGSTHICDKNCNQKIVYDNYSCICRVSHQVFPLTAAEQQAVRGVVRRRAESDFAEGGCSSKRRRDAFMHHHQSPFERSFCVVAPICSQPGDSLQMLIVAALFDHIYVACNMDCRELVWSTGVDVVFLNRKSVWSH